MISAELQLLKDKFLHKPPSKQQVTSVHSSSLLINNPTWESPPTTTRHSGAQVGRMRN